MNDNENRLFQTWNAAKAVLRGKLIAINAILRQREDPNVIT